MVCLEMGHNVGVGHGMVVSKVDWTNVGYGAVGKSRDISLASVINAFMFSNCLFECAPLLHFG